MSGGHGIADGLRQMQDTFYAHANSTNRPPHMVSETNETYAPRGPPDMYAKKEEEKKKKEEEARRKKEEERKKKEAEKRTKKTNNGK
ncbi:hypothetical protein D9613_009954 [Agrocybe pediades]|uniref:Uncharacterized protein n=1 Tax=Agrocybe pediades TaxID=84607 RepID=A0A8H4QW75_9AGAR|nr:hypothetical protein D9613_009954 [Agrocybe pediades]